MVFKNSNTQLLHITNHTSPKTSWKKIKYLPKTSGSLPVLSWNPTIFWSFSKYPKPAIIWIRFFFQIPGAGGSLVLKFFKYPERAGITKMKYPPHTGFLVQILVMQLMVVFCSPTRPIQNLLLYLLVPFAHGWSCWPVWPSSHKQTTPGFPFRDHPFGWIPIF